MSKTSYVAYIPSIFCYFLFILTNISQQTFFISFGYWIFLLIKNRIETGLRSNLLQFLGGGNIAHILNIAENAQRSKYVSDVRIS